MLAGDKIMRFFEWLGVSFGVGSIGLILLGPPYKEGNSYSVKQAWGFILFGVAIGWFLGRFPA
jgi:hypothetical protein